MASVVIKVSPLQASKCSMKLQWAPEHSSRTKALYITTTKFLQGAPQMSPSSGTISVQTDRMPSSKTWKDWLLLENLLISVLIVAKGWKKKKKAFVYCPNQTWVLIFVFFVCLFLTSTAACCVWCLRFHFTTLVDYRHVKTGYYMVGGVAETDRNDTSWLLQSWRSALTYQLCVSLPPPIFLSVSVQTAMVTTSPCLESVSSLVLLGTQLCTHPPNQMWLKPGKTSAKDLV